MNAQTPIKPDESILGTTQERALRHAISIHCPNQNELAMTCRVDIAMMRDRASAAMFRAGPSAAALLGQVARIGSIQVYAPATDTQLMKIRSALRQTIDAARALERAQVDG